MKNSQRTSFLLAILLGAFALAGGTGLTVSSAWMITMASEQPPIMVLGVSIVLVRFFGIFRSVARYLERVMSHEAIFRKLTSLRVKLFQSISREISTHSISTSVKAIVDDVERAQEFFLRITLPAYAAALSALVTLTLAIWIDLTTFFIVFVSTLVLALLIPYLSRSLLDPASVEIEDSENEFAQRISSAAHAMVEAEVFGYGDQYRKKLVEMSEELEGQERRLLRRTWSLQMLLTLTLGIAVSGVALHSYLAKEILPIHVSMAIFLALVGFEGYTSWFPNLFTSGKIRRASVNVASIATGSVEVALPATSTPSGFKLVCKNVSPYWSEQFLKPISFTLDEGQILLINGASGLGKSTLAGALLGLAHFDGEITVGGVVLKELEHGTIAGTLQRGHIFNTSLRENLKIAQPCADDDELLRILHLVELEEISLDEILGEFGRTLSGGEAKRLAIARALLSRAQILILDEPLEHIDHERALRLQRAIVNECKGRTLIVITHAPWLQYSLKLELARE
jgi:thiol reductant ABC exporter CydC subunit